MSKQLQQHDYIKTALRLPKELHSSIKASADENGRSMNAEILARLQLTHMERTIDEVAQQNAELKTMIKEILEFVRSSQ